MRSLAMIRLAPLHVAVRIYGFDKKRNMTHAAVFVDYGVLGTKNDNR